MPTLADAASVGTSRLQLRRDVSDLLSDLVVAVATVAGTTTAFTDAYRLSGPVNAFASREAYFTGGTVANLAQLRYVSASSTAGLLTVAALPAATAVGDEVELRNTRNQGWSVDAIHRAINTALSDANNGLWARAQDALTTFSATTATHTTPTLFSRSNPYLSIPNPYSHLYSVEYQDSGGYWHEIEAARESDEPGWRVIPGQRQMQIQGFFATDADTRAIRVLGYKRFAPMTQDTDTTTVNAEWLRYQTAAYLMLQGSERMGDGSRTQKYMTYQSRADRLRDLVSGAPDARAVAVL